MRLGNIGSLGGFGAGLQQVAMGLQRAPQMRQAVDQVIPQAINALPWGGEQPMAPRQYQTPGSVGFGAPSAPQNPGMLGGFGGFGGLGGFGGYGALRYPSFGYGGGWPFLMQQMMRRFY